MYLSVDGFTWIMSQRLVASDKVTYAQLGNCVVIHDGVIVAGASYDKTASDVQTGNATSCLMIDLTVAMLYTGSVYIYRTFNNGGTWSEVQKLLPTDGLADDRFGEALNLQSGFLTIGAHLDDNAMGLNAGK